MKEKKRNDRREFIKKLGQGTAAVAAMMSAGPLLSFANRERGREASAQQAQRRYDVDSMTYRVNRHTKDKVSLLGWLHALATQRGFPRTGSG